MRSVDNKNNRPSLIPKNNYEKKRDVISEQSAKQIAKLALENKVSVYSSDEVKISLQSDLTKNALQGAKFYTEQGRGGNFSDGLVAGAKTSGVVVKAKVEDLQSGVQVGYRPVTSSWMVEGKKEIPDANFDITVGIGGNPRPNSFSFKANFNF